MHQVLMGALSALSFGIADFLASRSSRRIGAPSALAGMLFVSSLALTAVSAWQGSVFQIPAAGAGLAGLHGAAMALALLLFFRAMQIGPVTVAAPIVATHPLFVIAFALAAGSQPNALQLAAMLGTVAGLVIVCSGSRFSPQPASRAAILCAVAASIVYAAAIVSAQEAMRHADALAVLWLGRLLGLMTMAAFFLIRQQRPDLPLAWWPFFCVHGALDSGGLLFLLLGSGRELHEITAVVGSTFSMVTVALAWLFLRERISSLQLAGIIVIAGCVATLAWGG